MSEDTKQATVNLWTPESITKALDAGQISEEEGWDLYINHRLKGNYYDMEPDEIEFAWDSGKLTDSQVEKYVQRRENPFWWWTKDLAKSVPSGLGKAYSSINNLLVDTENWAREKVGLPQLGANLRVEVLPEWQPESLPGKIGEVATQFAIPYGGSVKAVRGLGWVTRIMESPKMAALVKNAPRVAKAMQATLEGIIAGAPVDFAAFDPFEGRLSDLMEEHDLLPEFMDFMTTDPDNPAALERLKNAMEGAFVGTAFEAVLYAAKAMRAAAHQKYKGVVEEAARDAAANPKMAKAMREAREKEAALTMHKKEIVEPEASRGVDSSGRRPKKVKMPKKAPNVAEILATEPKAEVNNLIKHIEDLDGDAETIMRQVMDSAEDIIANETKRQGHGTTKYKSTKHLSQLVGSSEEAIMSNMRAIYGEVKGATEKVHAMYRTLTTHTDELTKMAKAYDGSAEQMLRITEHMKLNQELQAMVYGVRAESGRLLNMHNMKISKKRFDFSEFSKQMDLPEAITRDKEKLESAIRKIADGGSLQERMKFTRFLGKGGILPWLMSHRQAALLWSPITHATNIGTQAGVLALRMLNRGIGYGLTAAVKRNKDYLKAYAKEWAGYKHALGVAFKGVPNLKKAGKAYLSNRSVREVFLKDPEIGTFYRAFFGRDSVIDPSILKIEDATWLETAIKNSTLGKIGTGLDAMLKIPFSFLTGFDELFKTFGVQSEYYSQLYRRGIDMGLSGKELDKWFNKELAKAPKADLMAEAMKVGREVTFQDELGRAARGIENALNTPLGFIPKFLAIPFYKTTVNIMKFAGRSTPLGFFSKRMREALTKGGPEAFEAISRMTLGTAALAWGYSLYEDGKITGRFPPKMRNALREAGVKEYAYYNERAGEWIDYRRTYPFGLWLSAAADFHQAMDILDQYKTGEYEQEIGDVISGFTAAFLEPTINATWMKGAADLMDTINNPERSSHRWGRFGLQQLESLIPGTTLIDWANQEFRDDNVLRETNHMVDILYKKIDSTKMLPKRSMVYGTPLEGMDRWMFAAHRTKMTEDPVLQEIAKIGMNIQSPRDYLQFVGEKVKVTPEELDRFEQIYSQFPVKDTLTRLVTAEGFQQIGDEQTKGKIISSIISAFRGAAKAVFLSENHKVTQELIDKALNRAAAIAGYRTAQTPQSALMYYEQFYERQ